MWNIWSRKNNKNGFCYQFSNDGPDFLFGDLRIWGKSTFAIFYIKNKSLWFQYAWNVQEKQRATFKLREV